VICPKCKEQGRKSTISIGMSTITAAYYAPYYDQEGIYHYHDGNNRTDGYICSNGHRIVVRGTGKCPNCSWGHLNEKIAVEDLDTINTLTVDGNGLVSGNGMVSIGIKND